MNKEEIYNLSTSALDEVARHPDKLLEIQATGRMIYEEQQPQMDSPEFKRWAEEYKAAASKIGKFPSEFRSKSHLYLLIRLHWSKLKEKPSATELANMDDDETDKWMEKINTALGMKTVYR